EQDLQIEKRRSRELSLSPWYSLKNFNELYRQHLASEKSRILSNLTKEYERTLNSLPLISFLHSSSPGKAEVLSSLIEINRNAIDRASDSKISMAQFYVDKLNIKQD